MRLFHWRLPNTAQLAAKTRDPHLFQWKHLDPPILRLSRAPWNRLKIYKSLLRNLANTSPFCWSIVESTKKRSHVIQVPTQIHLIYKQTIQTNHPTKIDWLFFDVFSGWPGQGFQTLSIKSIVCSKSKFGGFGFHGGFQHFATWRIQHFAAGKSSPGCPGSGGWNEQVRHDGWSGHWVSDLLTYIEILIIHSL